MKKLLACILSLVIFCSCAVFAAAEAKENVVTYAMAAEPNLDPHWNAGSTGATVLDCIREGLYKVTATGIALAGAESVTVNEDATVWTFNLRKDSVWNDGKPVVAGDYVYSMQRLVDPAVSSYHMLAYGQFLLNGSEISAGTKDVSELGVKAIDDYTLEITLANSCTFFDTILTYSTFFPLRADTVTEDGIGDWAWNVENSITNGEMNMTFCDETQKIVLEKNATYWNAESVNTDKIVIKLVDDTNTTLALLETGEVDVIDSFSSEEVQRLQEAGLYHSSPKLSTNFLLVNCMDNEGNAMVDPRVRKALSLSIDREFMCDVLLMGTKTPAVSFVGGGFPGSTPEVDFRTEAGDLFHTDIEQAQALMAEAGYPGGEGFPLLTCTYANNSADNTTIFEYLQSTWEENLGITVHLEPMEKAAVSELRGAGKFDITPQNWGADYMDASNMLSIFLSTNNINRGKFASEEYDATYDKALQTVDQKARMDLLHRCEEILLDECGVISLYHSNAVAIYSEDVLENVKLSADGKIMLTDIIKK